MEIRVKAGSIQTEIAPLIVVNLFEGVTEPGGATGAVDRALGGQIRELISAGDFRGKRNETVVLYPGGAIPAQRVLVVGLGKEEKFDLDGVRQAAGAAAKKARELGVTRFSTIVHGGGRAGLNLEDAAQAVVEGTILALYRFREHKTEPAEDERPDIEAVTLVEFSAEKVPVVERGARTGQIIAEAVNMARDLVNQPANYATPAILAETAQKLAADFDLRCQVLDREQMAELGMGALLGVAQGSEQPPKFIILEHNADRDDRSADRSRQGLDTIVLVGKGITFDSGGISIKPGEHMEEMKADMAGAAAVMGALRAAAALDVPLHVVGLMPATENLPSGRAIKPGDVLKSLSGLTIEVISTDAEGRLILADALAYAQRYQPQAVVDIATLTGACVVALGEITTGLMGTDADLVARIKAASAKTAEKVWELPLFEEYGEQIKSDVADVKNTGGRPAGTITAAFFLSKFAKGMPWAHLDIAGKALTDKERNPYTPKGATGVGVRLFVQLLRDWGK
ncbi:MAG: leucyl aminopeptidase [Anaerolineae bacterium]|jgi:leucyl aminopeptidase|nr:leucyl aminopeptidase [Anaerolineae bacterium]MDH7472563.1 leucyl aminopeptidase [Anaerolineae bacterium]